MFSVEHFCPLNIGFNRALTSVNLLQNDLGDGAAAIVAAAKQQGNIKTVCGIAEGQSKFIFEGDSRNGYLYLITNTPTCSLDLPFKATYTD